MKQFRPSVAACALCCMTELGTAGVVQVDMRDGDGSALADAVLAAYPLDQKMPAPTHASAVMNQRGQRFDPHVLVVRKGTAVDFPNLDRTRHHVYSFSAARRFELKLYLGEAAAPVRFDTPGIVTLGCNIHDWMLGYVVVLDTPYFTRSGSDGQLTLNLPDGTYRLWAWHPRMPEQSPALDEVVQSTSIPLRRVVQPALGPAPDMEPPQPLGLPVVGKAQ